MILVDTSVWISLLSAKPRRPVLEEYLHRFVTCAPVIQAVLQGLRPGVQSDAFRTAFLALPVVGDPVPIRLYIAAADIYREGRRRGITIRSSVDCLIAAISMEHGATVWHRDRDFAAIAAYTPLQVFEGDLP